jgi:ABC-2 type transport system permease protein
MIPTILRISWLNLKRDRTALGMTFVLPIAFFSVFAMIFGGMTGGHMDKVSVAMVDEDHSEASRRFVQAMQREDSLKVSVAPEGKPDQPFSRSDAAALVKNGKLPIAVIVPGGFGETFGSFGKDQVPVEVVTDESNPVASQMVAGLMQKVGMTAAPDLMITRGLDMFDRFKEETGGLTPQQRAAMDRWLPELRTQLEQRDREEQAENAAAATRPAQSKNAQAKKNADVSAGFAGPVNVKISGLHSDRKDERASLNAFQAAGTGVMFLLFAMAGAGGALLEDQESGTLERLLSSNIGMSGLLYSKWLFIALVGMLQVVLMFAWGSLPIFGIDLWSARHFWGFLVMTAVTAAAAGGFGMMLATACRSRGQLGGISTIVILTMSAVGGSMIPRWAMPDTIKQAGLATFNGWALDGYYKIFWYDDPAGSVLNSVTRLWPQIAVLAGLTVAFLAIARLLARRWEMQ